MANPRPRYIRPTVQPEVDTPVVQLKCDPSEDEFDVDELIYQAVKRFEFQVGTIFYVQLVSLDMESVLACRQYIMQFVKGTMRTDELDFYRTMTRMVYDRKFEPMCEWMVFDERAEASSAPRAR